MANKMQRQNNPNVIQIKRNEADLAWAAGFFDGEGHIVEYKGRPTQLTVAQKDDKPLRKLKRLFSSGRIYYREFKLKSGKDSWIYTWAVTGKAVPTILELMLPYLCVKKQEAEGALTNKVNYQIRNNINVSTIRALRYEGYTLGEIGEKLGRSPTWVQRQLGRLEEAGEIIPKLPRGRQRRDTRRGRLLHKLYLKRRRRAHYVATHPRSGGRGEH